MLLTLFSIKAAMRVVLFPGDAHISNIASPGFGFKACTQTIEGIFCNKAHPRGKKSPKAGQPEIVSVTSTATPLNQTKSK